MTRMFETDDQSTLLDWSLQMPDDRVQVETADVSDVRTALRVAEDALSRAVGRISHCEADAETLDDLTDRISALLAETELLRVALASAIDRAGSAEPANAEAARRPA